MSVIADRYYYTFRASSGAVVRVLRGDGPPTMVGGGGGWSVENRPRRIGFTLWQGRDPYRMDVPVLFDGWPDDSVEDDIARLNQMQIGGDLQEPPTITISGAVPIKGATWVIEGIDWSSDDENVYWVRQQGSDFRLRQAATIHLLQFKAEERLKVTVARALPNVYITKKGDTLRSVARDMYGNASKWTVIKKANPKIKDPNNIPAKTRLTIP